MTENLKSRIEGFKNNLKSMTQDEILRCHELQRRANDEEYSRFITGYKQKVCYLCSKPFATISKNTPCVHWLLRRCKFKKKAFPSIFHKFDYHQISSFLRWIANAEVKSKNINNLKEESLDKKLFETTIRWKNIEWTFDCSTSDFRGHEGTRFKFPHWHFQMRIDGNRFIGFNDFHIPFSEHDLMLFSIEHDESLNFRHSFGPEGIGMQEIVDTIGGDYEQALEHIEVAENPEDGAVHIQTMVSAPSGITGEQIEKAKRMSVRTGRPLGYCIQKTLEKDETVGVKTIISPADGVPEIARRRSRKNNRQG